MRIGMPGSLRGRLAVLLLLLVAAGLASGAIMVGLFQQSASAQAARAEAQVSAACEAIAGAYRFYSAGGATPDADANQPRDLRAVVQFALRDRPGIEGGIWQANGGPLTYAYPTYQGAGPKTDIPEAELPRITEANSAAASAGRQETRRYDANTQTLVIASCPLAAASNLTGWAMTRVYTFAGRSYETLMAGLAVLLVAVLAAVWLSVRLALTWSRHVAQIEKTLASHDIAELPVLAETGERELDRIVVALNEAGGRLAAARHRAEIMSRQIAIGERLAAIGRVAAGLAHEIRNPIAAMRLKAENARDGDAARQGQALAFILEQVARLDALVRRVLNVTERDEPQRHPVELSAFLQSCCAAHTELAAAKSVTLECAGVGGTISIDPDQMRRAIDNLVLNAIHAAPRGSTVQVETRRADDRLVIAVRDQGEGPPEAIRDQLFEPFVTGRADGTGLGLPIVREVAEAHGGTARLASFANGTCFEIELPWPPS